jgi:hypothetical protein
MGHSGCPTMLPLDLDTRFRVLEPLVVWKVEYQVSEFYQKILTLKLINFLDELAFTIMTELVWSVSALRCCTRSTVPAWAASLHSWRMHA